MSQSLNLHVALVVLAIGGCAAPSHPPSEQTASPEPSLLSSPSAPPTISGFPECLPSTIQQDVGSDSNPLIFSADYGVRFFPELLSQVEEWARKVSDATGLMVRVEVGPPTDAETMALIARGQVDLAYVHPLAQVLGLEECLIQVVASTGVEDTGIQAVMFVSRKDSGIVPGEEAEILPQLVGMRPCYQDPTHVFPPPLEGYVLPSGILRLAGVTVGSPVILEGSEENSFYASLETGVYAGDCDFASVLADVDPVQWVTNWLPGEAERIGATFHSWADRMQVLFTTEPLIPQFGVVVSDSVPAAVQRRLAEAILSIGGPWGEPLASPDQHLIARFAAIVKASQVDTQPFLERAAPIPENLTPIEWGPAPAGTAVIDTRTESDVPFLPDSTIQFAALIAPALSGQLARLDASGGFVPYLAEPIPSVENGLVRFVGEGEDEQMEVEFRLRPGARWQDGARLTANDLAFSWQYVMSSGFPASHWLDSDPAPEVFVASVEAVGADRITYHFMSQRQVRQASIGGGRLGDVHLYAGLADHDGPVVPLDFLRVGRIILPQHLIGTLAPDQFAGSEFARSPVSTGPYRIAEVTASGESLVLEANPYFLFGPPAIPKIIFGAGYYSEGALGYWQTPAALRQALSAGAIQAQVGLSSVNSRVGEDPTAYDALVTDGLANVTWVPRQAWETLDFNLDNPHLADPLVRQAIAHAIDRQRIIDEVLDGHADLMRSYLPDWHPLYAGDLALPDYEYDPGLANELLRDAGYDISRSPVVHPTRGRLVLRLASMDVNFYPRPPIAEIIRQNLEEIGIEVQVQFYTWPEFEADDCSGVRNGRRFDLGLAGWGGAPSLFPVGWVEQVTAIASIPTQENGCPFDKSNWSGWRNAETERLIASLKDGRLALEDAALYRQAWAEHQLLWATDLPSLPLFNPERPVTVSPNLHGVQPSPFGIGGGVEDTWNIWDWELRP